MKAGQVGRAVWTEAMDRLLLDWLGDGKRFLDVADALGVSRNAVAGRAHRMRMKVNVGARKARNVERRPKLVVLKPPKPKPRPEPGPYTGMVSFSKLAWHHCRYPLGTDKRGRLLYCGKTRDGMVSYCPEHRKLCLHQSRERVKEAV